MTNVLSHDMIILLCNLLDDEIIRIMSKLTKKYRRIITKYFRDYLIILKSMNPIIIIECRHPDFNKFWINRNNNKQYTYYRFITSYNEIYLTNFKYIIRHRSNRRSSQEELDERLIANDNIMYINPNKQVSINKMVYWLKTKILDVMSSNNFPLYVDKSDYKYSPKTNNEMITVVTNELSSEMRSSWAVDCSDTYYSINMVHLNKSIDTFIYMPGYINLLTGMRVINGLRLYLTHDNGARSFLVIHKNKNVTILKEPDWNNSKFVHDNDDNSYNHDNDDDNDFSNNKLRNYTVKIMKYKNVKRVLPGEDVNKEYFGNSVLLDLGDNRYVFIGSNIYEFNTPANEYINKFYSLVGNNDVAYPVALSQTYAYFMLDLQYLSKSKFPEECDWMDSYSHYYGHTSHSTDKMVGEQFLNHKQIHMRIW